LRQSDNIGEEGEKLIDCVRERVSESDRQRQRERQERERERERETET
jgi:hypothetical protein